MFMLIGDNPVGCCCWKGRSFSWIVKSESKFQNPNMVKEERKKGSKEGKGTERDLRLSLNGPLPFRFHSGLAHEFWGRSSTTNTKQEQIHFQQFIRVSFPLLPLIFHKFFPFNFNLKSIIVCISDREIQGFNLFTYIILYLKTINNNVNNICSFYIDDDELLFILIVRKHVEMIKKTH